MARIVIAAYGSRGDLAPLTDFGARLRGDGHDVVMTSTPDLVDDITACGIAARPVDFEMDADIENPARAAMQLVLPKGMRQLGRNLLTALDDVPADILLLSPFAELAGHPLAEARGIPSIGVRLQPMSTTAEFPPALLGGWSAGSLVNRGAGRFAAAAIDRVYGKVVADFRAQLDLPPVSAKKLRRARTAAEWPVLHGFSPTVLPRPADWRPGLEVTGYWWPRRPADWTPPADVVDFLESGSPPVFLGLGSLIVSSAESARLSEIMHEALQTVGVRGIVQAGGAALNVSGADVLTVGAIPHDWLFGKVAAVVHSCGAGTMAAGLRAGLQAVAVPSPGGDQPFWARRLRELGASSATIPRPKLTATKLARAIEAASSEPTYRSRAEELAAQIDREDGAGRVVAAVEQLVRV